MLGLPDMRAIVTSDGAGKEQQSPSANAAELCMCEVGARMERVAARVVYGAGAHEEVCAALDVVTALEPHVEEV